MRNALLLFATACGLLVAGCQYPRDVEGTLDRVEGGTMRVGVIDDPPWAVVGKGDPTGVEPELVKRFAEDLDAQIEWYPGTEEELVEAMRGFQLDVIVGGLTRSSPAGSHAALTRPYIDTELEYGLAPGDRRSMTSTGGRSMWSRAARPRR